MPAKLKKIVKETQICKIEDYCRIYFIFED